MSRKRVNDGSDEEGIELVELKQGSRTQHAREAAQTYLHEDPSTEPEVYCRWCEANNNDGNLSSIKNRGGKSKSNSDSSNSNRQEARFFATIGCTREFTRMRTRNNKISGSREDSWKTIGCPGCCICELCKKRMTYTPFLQEASRGGLMPGGEVGDEL